MHLEEIATDLQGSVLTSLSMQQVLELASYARGLSSQDFTQMVLGLPEYGYGAVINSPEGIIWVEEPLWGAHQPDHQSSFSKIACFKVDEPSITLSN